MTKILIICGTHVAFLQAVNDRGLDLSRCIHVHDQGALYGWSKDTVFYHIAPYNSDTEFLMFTAKDFGFAVEPLPDTLP